MLKQIRSSKYNSFINHDVQIEIITNTSANSFSRLVECNEILEDFISAFYYLKNNEHCNGKVGVVGFCFAEIYLRFF